MPWRQGALDVIERRVDALGQLQRVRARLLLDTEDDGGLGVVRSLAALERRAVANDRPRRARAPALGPWS